MFTIQKLLQLAKYSPGLMLFIVIDDIKKISNDLSIYSSHIFSILPKTRIISAWILQLDIHISGFFKLDISEIIIISSRKLQKDVSFFGNYSRDILKAHENLPVKLYFIIAIWNEFFVTTQSKNFPSAKNCQLRSKIIGLTSAIVWNMSAIKNADINLGCKDKMADHIGNSTFILKLVSRSFCISKCYLKPTLHSLQPSHPPVTWKLPVWKNSE